MKRTRINPFQYIGTPKASKWIVKSFTHRFNLISGAVRSSKDYNATIAFVEAVKRIDYDLFLIGAVDVKNALRIIGRYILNYIPTARKTMYMEAPAIVFEYNGFSKTIIFAGGKNNGSDIGIQGLTLGAIYLTEINLLNEDFINQAIKRTSSFKEARIFGTYNPKGTRHWFKLNIFNVWNNYQLEHPDKKWLNFDNFELKDNPVLDDEMIDQIKSSYDPTSTAYKRDILGLESNPEGSLYTLREYNTLKNINFKDYKRYVTVVDIGESTSSTTFLMGAPYFNPEKNQWELHILREYNHINNSVNEMQKKSSIQYIGDYIKFIKESIELMDGRHPDVILFDGTDQFFRDLRALIKENGLGQHTPKRVTKDKEEDRIYQGQSWLYQGKLKFYKDCKLTIQDFTNAENDDKVYERTGKIVTKNEYTVDGHMDRLDGTNYIMTYYTGIIK